MSCEQISSDENNAVVKQMSENNNNNNNNINHDKYIANTVANMYFWQRLYNDHDNADYTLFRFALSVLTEKLKQYRVNISAIDHALKQEINIDIHKNDQENNAIISSKESEQELIKNDLEELKYIDGDADIHEYCNNTINNNNVLVANNLFSEKSEKQENEEQLQQVDVAEEVTEEFTLLAEKELSYEEEQQPSEIKETINTTSTAHNKSLAVTNSKRSKRNREDSKTSLSKTSELIKENSISSSSNNSENNVGINYAVNNETIVERKMENIVAQPSSLSLSPLPKVSEGMIAITETTPSLTPITRRETKRFHSLTPLRTTKKCHSLSTVKSRNNTNKHNSVNKNKYKSLSINTEENMFPLPRSVSLQMEQRFVSNYNEHMEPKSKCNNVIDITEHNVCACTKTNRTNDNLNVTCQHNKVKQEQQEQRRRQEHEQEEYYLQEQSEKEEEVFSMNENKLQSRSASPQPTANAIEVVHISKGNTTNNNNKVCQERLIEVQKETHVNNSLNESTKKKRNKKSRKEEEAKKPKVDIIKRNIEMTKSKRKYVVPNEFALPQRLTQVLSELPCVAHPSTSHNTATSATHNVSSNVNALNTSNDRKLHLASRSAKKQVDKQMDNRVTDTKK